MIFLKISRTVSLPATASMPMVKLEKGGSVEEDDKGAEAGWRSAGGGDDC